MYIPLTQLISLKFHEASSAVYQSSQILTAYCYCLFRKKKITQWNIAWNFFQSTPLKKTDMLKQGPSRANLPFFWNLFQGPRTAPWVRWLIRRFFPSGLSNWQNSTNWICITMKAKKTYWKVLKEMVLSLSPSFQVSDQMLDSTSSNQCAFIPVVERVLKSPTAC